MIMIDREKCIPCPKCVDVCPSRIYTWKAPEEEVPRVEIENQEFCILCGHCVAICPEDAVLHEKLPLESFTPLEAVKITAEALRNLMLSRRSIRAYKSDPVPRIVIEQLLEVAIHAGTASNRQDVAFTVVQDKKVLAELETEVLLTLWNQSKRLGNPLLRRLARFKYGESQIQAYYRYYKVFKRRMEMKERISDVILRGAPAVIILHTPGRHTLEEANCALSIANMTVLAQTMGLGVCWGGFVVDAAHRSSRINRILEIPKFRKIMGCLMIGYPKHRYLKRIPRNQPNVKWL
ncbi:MAG: nitroreductase family protein [Candidatus Heimdallarchaeota archaeon]